MKTIVKKLSLFFAAAILLGLCACGKAGQDGILWENRRFTTTMSFVDDMSELDDDLPEKAAGEQYVVVKLKAAKKKDSFTRADLARTYSAFLLRTPSGDEYRPVSVSGDQMTALDHLPVFKNANLTFLVPEGFSLSDLELVIREMH